jgi:fatty acid desaturase
VRELRSSSDAIGDLPILFTALSFSISSRDLIDRRVEQSDNARLEKEVPMLAIIAAVLVVLWLLGFLAFHISSGLIHLLLICAVISFIVHVFRGRASTA